MLLAFILLDICVKILPRNMGRIRTLKRSGLKHFISDNSLKFNHEVNFASSSNADIGFGII